MTSTGERLPRGLQPETAGLRPDGFAAPNIGSVPVEVEAWRRFRGTRGIREINVADFIESNVHPYTGDGAFLSGPTARTTALWDRVSAMLVEERRRGIYDVDPATPAGITAHAPGYLDKDAELIV